MFVGESRGGKRVREREREREREKESESEAEKWNKRKMGVRENEREGEFGRASPSFLSSADGPDDNKRTAQVAGTGTVYCTPACLSKTVHV